MDNTNKIINLVAACKEINIKINPPNINVSNFNFEPVNKESINYGLCAIKGVGESAAKHISDIRLNSGIFTSIEDFVQKLISIRSIQGTIESLISSGCFDSISVKSRTENIENLHSIMLQGQKNQNDIASGQNQLFMNDKKTSNHGNMEDISKNVTSNNELIRERKVLGYYLSSHPMNKHYDELCAMKLKNILDINNLILQDKTTKINTTIAGVIVDSRTQKINKNKYINIFKVDDGNQYMNISFFEEKYLKYKNIIKEDIILFFTGETFIDDYDSQLSMRADDVYTLDTARDKYSKYIQIVLSSDLISRQKILDIKKIISRNNSGKTKVMLTYKTRDVIAPINSKQDLYVKINDEFLSEIRSIAGTNNVQIKYQ